MFKSYRLTKLAFTAHYTSTANIPHAVKCKWVAALALLYVSKQKGREKEEEYNNGVASDWIHFIIPDRQ